MKIPTLPTVALALVHASGFAQQAAAPLWTNSILPQRADPHVMLHNDGWYYFTATAPEYDRIELRRARTLAGLPDAKVQVAWKKHSTGPMSHHIWAPEIHHIQGKWYLYFAAGRAEAIWDIRMYVLENDSANPLDGNWQEKGQMKMNWESFTLDGSTFAHKGKRYFIWAQRALESEYPGTSIYIAEMDTPWSITGKQVRLSSPLHPWEKTTIWVNEAPAMIHRNRKLFMTYSAGSVDANYCLGMLTASEDSNLLDPASWSKSKDPVLKTHVGNSQYGPGHNCFTTSVDGKTDYIVYHSRNYEKVEGNPLLNPDRATRAQIIKWKIDGNPDFGVPVADGPYTP